LNQQFNNLCNYLLNIFDYSVLFPAQVLRSTPGFNFVRSYLMLMTIKA